MSLRNFIRKANDFIEKSRVRRWIDGDDADKGLEDVYNSSPKNNDVEEFLAQVSRTIANLMKMKKFVIPNGEVYLPREFT